MIKQYFFSYLLAGLIALNVSQLKAQQAIKPCQNQPTFIRTLGFDPLWTGLSTSEKTAIGISLVVFDKKPGQTAPDAQSAKSSTYQHPSWKKAGYLSTITLDVLGNVYTIPAPLISMLYNKTEKLNTIYRIDANTGDLNEWVSLPFAAKPSSNNPYGLLGLSYDCKDHILAASTVAGSDRYNERGVLYTLNTSSKKIIDSIRNIDVMGIGFALDEAGNKRLYFGRTRTGDIYSVIVNVAGKMIKKSTRKELSLDGYGPRGDDKARKIKFDGNQLIVSGTAFNYNLQASSEKPETVYTFIWVPKNKKWGLINYQ